VRKAIEPSATRAIKVSRLQGFGQHALKARVWLILGRIEQSESVTWEEGGALSLSDHSEPHLKITHKPSEDKAHIYLLAQARAYSRHSVPWETRIWPKVASP
jgi:hypothetical protein